MNLKSITVRLIRKVMEFGLPMKMLQRIFCVSGILVFMLQVYSVNAGNMMTGEATEDQIDSLLKRVELIPVMINGDKDNRINIVIMNRWTTSDKEPYNSPEMRDEFISDINESLIAALTPGDEKAQTAYANYRNFFNVYGLWYPDSPEWNKGINSDMVDALRDRLFLPWKDPYTGWVTFLIMPNRDSGGGGAARNLEKRVGTALIAGNGIGKMLHEIAHTCMSIGDEYTAEATGTSAVPTYTVEKEYSRDKIKWRKWIEPDTPLPTPYTEDYRDKVGAFEGAQYHLTNYFRSTAQGCIMGAGVFDNTEKMCPICEQRVAMRANTLVNPVVSFTPEKTSLEISGKTTVRFTIDYIKPMPNTQVLRWFLNGKIIATGQDEIEVEFGNLAEYELVCTLIDESPFIRPDPPFASYPKREIKWKISNSRPVTDVEPLKVEIRIVSGNQDFKLQSRIKGGKPPYALSWSTGSEERELEKAGPGIYSLTVHDSEFRNATASHTIFFSECQHENKITATVRNPKSKDLLQLEAEVTTPEKDRQNGKIFLRTKGGNPPYSYEWSDTEKIYTEGLIYEAENAEVKIPGHTVGTFEGAGNNAFLSFGGSEGSVKWNIEVVRAGLYPVDFVFGGISPEGTVMNLSVNGNRESESLMFAATRPLFTGWDKVTVMCELREGKNIIELFSAGKSGANLDYLKVPCNFNPKIITGSERWNLPPGDYSVTVTDSQNRQLRKTFTLTEEYPFKITGLGFKKTASVAIAITKPLNGYVYNWYRNDIQPFRQENDELPLFTGDEFVPPVPGNYYVSAKNKLTHAESTNRICLGIGKTPTDKSINEMNPNILEEKVKLWFDSGDLDGDGNKDEIIPERGPLKEWKAKTWRNPGKIFAKFTPNILNGMGICGFDNVWISRLGIDSIRFQTIIFVYRESSMSLPGTSPFRELNKYIGKSTVTGKRLFDPGESNEATKKGSVYLNGVKIDPFITPNPMEFCILTIELGSEVKEGISVVDGNWEGQIAEMIFLDGLLSDTDRKGIEEHLRKKWFAAVDLDFQ